MGKEWHWVGGKSSKKGGTPVDKESSGATSGCMCSVFQLFDFHQFQLPSQQPQQQPSLHLDDTVLIPKGAEAPRNSLELDGPQSLNTMKDAESLIIPVSAIHTRPNGYTSDPKPHDSSSSEISCSPSAKTPTLVARLMGLDLLPDHQTYSESPISAGKSHLRRVQTKNSDFSGTRSLPETPRISSARRSDVEHRLSLQINKENVSPNEEVVLSRISPLKRKKHKADDENGSPGHYARQIVKQVKESVGRKVGLDITNTVVRRDNELVNQIKNKRLMSKVLANKVGSDDSSSASKNITANVASCSPRLKVSEPRNNKPASAVVPPQTTKDHNTNSPVNIMPKKAKAPMKPTIQEQVQQRPMKKCKKVGEDRFGPLQRVKKPPQTSDIIRNKQEETFVRQATVTRTNIPDKKCKKTPLSNDLLSISVPTLLPVKKDTATTLRLTNITQKQVPNNAQCSSQLSSCVSQSYKEQEVMYTQLNAPGNRIKNEDRFNGAATATTTTDTAGDRSEREEYEYISRILRRSGIEKDTPVSFTRWFSPSHPLDPAIFYYLEYFNTISPSFTDSKNVGHLSHRSNRKLLFYLVDEILADILKPFLNLKPWVEKFGYFSTPITISSNFQGSDLVDMLCSKVRSFPCADCRVLEDIDALIETDMQQLDCQNDVAFAEEGEGLVAELEKDLLDTIVHETAAIFYGWDMR